MAVVLGCNVIAPHELHSYRVLHIITPTADLVSKDCTFPDAMPFTIFVFWVHRVIVIVPHELPEAEL